MARTTPKQPKVRRITFEATRSGSGIFAAPLATGGLRDVRMLKDNGTPLDIFGTPVHGLIGPMCNAGFYDATGLAPWGWERGEIRRFTVVVPAGARARKHRTFSP